MVLDPASHEAESRLRRTVLHLLGAPAFPFEDGEHLVDVATRARDVGMVRPSLRQRQVSRLQVMSSDVASKGSGPDLDGAAVLISGVDEEGSGRMGKGDDSSTKGFRQTARNPLGIKGRDRKMMDSHDFYHFRRTGTAAGASG